MRKPEFYLLLSVLAGVSALFLLNIQLYGNGDLFGASLTVGCCFIVLWLACLGSRFFLWIGILGFLLLALAMVAALLENDSYSFAIIALGYSLLVWRLIRHLLQKRATQFLQAAEEIQLPAQTFIANQKQFTYPLLLQRIQALFIDGMLLLALMMVVMIATDGSPHASIIRVGTMVVVLLCYEPILTTYGYTLGQRIMGIRVRHVNDPSKRINLFQSYIRFIVKSQLGWLSFITIHFNREHRAIHDLVCSSVMINLK